MKLSLGYRWCHLMGFMRWTSKQVNWAKLRERKLSWDIKTKYHRTNISLTKQDVITERKKNLDECWDDWIGKKRRQNTPDPEWTNLRLAWLAVGGEDVQADASISLFHLQQLTLYIPLTHHKTKQDLSEPSDTTKWIKLLLDQAKNMHALLGRTS